MYGEVKTGRCWNDTVSQCVCGKIIYYNRYFYNPSLLFRPTQYVATSICTDDAAKEMPKLYVPKE